MTDAEFDAAFAAAMGSKPKPMTEPELQDAVLAECARLGLRVFRIPHSARAGIRGGGKGWPDLVIAGDGGIIFRECKSAYGDTRIDQDWWGWYLRNAGHDWAVWRPADLENGRITAELTRLTHGQPSVS